MSKTQTLRSSLIVDTIYRETSSGTYFVTPDGVGCFWYDTYEEALDQHGDTGDVEDIESLADF